MGLLTKEEAPEVTMRPYTPLVNLKCSDRPINTKPLSGRPGAMFTGMRIQIDCLKNVGMFCSTMS